MNDKILSCFIDESGDFGPYDYHAPLYIVSVVLHDQSIDISDHIKAHEDFFRSFDQIIVYYDNGQTELTKIITSVFNTLFSNVDIRRVKPVDYKLFQVADLICTLELLHEKTEANSLTRSETEFFHSPREFQKEYYRKIVKKHI